MSEIPVLRVGTRVYLLPPTAAADGHCFDTTKVAMGLVEDVYRAAREAHVAWGVQVRVTRTSETLGERPVNARVHAQVPLAPGAAFTVVPRAACRPVGVKNMAELSPTGFRVQASRLSIGIPSDFDDAERRAAQILALAGLAGEARRLAGAFRRGKTLTPAQRARVEQLIAVCYRDRLVDANKVKG